MKNPNGPYPGRQLFLGRTRNQQPILAYLITGRSPESRQRKAVPFDNSVRIGPAGNQPFDPLRHYFAIRYDNGSGIAVVSNGIQTEAVFETYKLLFNVNSHPEKDYLEKILDGAGAEPDSYWTPRIAGVVTYSSESKTDPIFIVGIKGHDLPAKAFIVKPDLGMLVGVSTYKGPLDNPKPNGTADALTNLESPGVTAEEIARMVFDISAADYKGNDIRVSSLGGVYVEKQGWEFSIINNLM